MTDSTQLHRDLGRLEGKFDGLDEKVESQGEDIAAMKRMLSRIDSTLSEARGGWKTLVVVGTISAAITGGLMKVLAVVWPK